MQVVPPPWGISTSSVPVIKAGIVLSLLLSLALIIPHNPLNNSPAGGLICTFVENILYSQEIS